MIFYSTFFVCLSFGVTAAAAGCIESVLALLLSIAGVCSPKSSFRCSAGLTVPSSPKNLQRNFD